MRATEFQQTRSKSKSKMPNYQIKFRFFLFCLTFFVLRQPKILRWHSACGSFSSRRVLGVQSSSPHRRTLGAASADFSIRGASAGVWCGLCGLRGLRADCAGYVRRGLCGQRAVRIMCAACGEGCAGCAGCAGCVGCVGCVRTVRAMCGGDCLGCVWWGQCGLRVCCVRRGLCRHRRLTERKFLRRMRIFYLQAMESLLVLQLLIVLIRPCSRQ